MRLNGSRKHSRAKMQIRRRIDAHIRPRDDFFSTAQTYERFSRKNLERRLVRTAPMRTLQEDPERSHDKPQSRQPIGNIVGLEA